MHNKVVYRAAQVLHECGMPVLRFNFRGAGLSEGMHDNGRGEKDDARAALDYLAQEFPGCPVLLAGFSFGSWVGLCVGCADSRVTRLVGIGLPVDNTDFTYLRDCAKPKLIIQGGSDQYGSRASIEALFETLPEPKRIAIVKGADHFFTGRLREISDAITDWIGQDG